MYGTIKALSIAKILSGLIFSAGLLLVVSPVSNGYPDLNDDADPLILEMEINDNDTIYIYNLDGIQIEESRSVLDRYYSRQFKRLMRDVSITMPYARLAAETLLEIDSTLVTLDTERERRNYLDSAEKKLMDQFEEDLKSLNRRQGLLLIKLIDRETGNTTYHLLREYRSRWSAFFWQGLARVFGMNLRTEYNPDKEEDIEEAISRLGYE